MSQLTKELSMLISRMKNLDENDPETAHLLADAILCDALIKLGQRELVEEFTKARARLSFWYS